MDISSVAQQCVWSRDEGSEIVWGARGQIFYSEVVTVLENFRSTTGFRTGGRSRTNLKGPIYFR